MFKRVIWMGTGMAVGAGGAFWAKHKVERTVERYLPDQVADRAAAQARGLGRTVRAAAAEGRAAMRDREAELRRQVEDRTFVGARAAEAVEPSAPAGAPRRARRPAEPRTPTPGTRRASRR